MKQLIKTIKDRWKAAMPVFFKWIMGIGTTMAGIALSIQLALDSGNAVIPEWWEKLYPYIIGIGAGMTATAKFTQKK